MSGRSGTSEYTKKRQSSIIESKPMKAKYVSANILPFGSKVFA